MLPEDIIIKPIITEKSNEEMQSGKYTFKVSKKATKVDVKRAVEKLFNVKVLKVNTVNVSGKEKRVGRNIGKTADWSKSSYSHFNSPYICRYFPVLPQIFFIFRVNSR